MYSPSYQQCFFLNWNKRISSPVILSVSRLVSRSFVHSEASYVSASSFSLFHDGISTKSHVSESSAECFFKLKNILYLQHLYDLHSAFQAFVFGCGLNKSSTSSWSFSFSGSSMIWSAFSETQKKGPMMLIYRAWLVWSRITCTNSS